MPRKYWPLAFATACYLINRLPTPTLHLQSPYFKLHGHTPNYLKLRSFGCLCYPWLRPYTSNKLDPRSSPCVFVGYYATQSTYYCLAPHANKIYVSQHVKFIEHEFLFSSSSMTASPHTSIETDEWCALLLPIIFAASSTPAIPFPNLGYLKHPHSFSPTTSTTPSHSPTK